MRRLAGCLFLIFGVFGVSARADDAISFVVAPPPVGYPVFSRGEVTTQAGANALYVGLDAAGAELNLYGVMGFGNIQRCLSDSLAVNGSFGAAVLAGDEYDLLFIQLPIGGNAVFRAARFGGADLYVFGGAGMNLGLSTMTVPVPQLVPNTTSLIQDDTVLSTTVVTAVFTAGAQGNVFLGDLVVSPFGLYSYSFGSYSTEQTSSMFYDYPSSSGDVPGTGSLVLGFDILHRPLGVALSSMLRSSSDYTLVSVSFKWLLSRR